MNRGMVGRFGSRALVGLALVVALLAAPLAVGAEERGAEAPDADGRVATSGTAGGMIAAAAPPHDHFADAQVLTGGVGLTVGNNVDATLEVDEPTLEPSYELDASVWFSWAAPASGTVTFTTQGAGIDTVLAVYTGSSVDDLDLVVENDEAIGSQSRVTFVATLGTTYRIQLAGYEGAEGGYELDWYTQGEPVLHDAFERARFIGGLEGSFEGTSDSATSEAGEPAHDGTGPNHSVWFTTIAPYDATVTYSIDALEHDPVIAAYTGTAVGSLTALASDTESFELEVDAGDLYSIAVASATFSDNGEYELTWTTELTQPGNDDFADAEAISGDDGSLDAHNLGATVETGEPEHAGELGGHSIWYEWEAPDSELISFDTFGSELDTLLAVYTGTAVDGLTEVASNDQYLGNQSLVSFAAEEGTTYRIAVDGYEGEEDLLRLSWAPVTSAFSDVSTTHPFFAEIAWMDSSGISTGYEDGTYRPSASVTRQAMSAFMYRLAGMLNLDEFDPPSAASFGDVGTSHPFFLEIEWMAETGISEGYPDDTFRPGAVVTRQAMSAFMHRFHDWRFELPPGAFEPPASPSFDDVGTGHPFYDDVEWMAETGVSTGYEDGTFRPSAAVTRQAMSAFLYRLWLLCTCAPI
jgi:hypothetical protein